jgi:transposase-like protein
LTVAAKRPNGQTVDFALTGKRDLATARRFFERAIDQHDIPKSITIDKNGANAAAVVIVHRHPAAPPPTGVVLQAQPRHFAAAAHAVKRGVQAQCVPVTFGP